MGLDTTSQLRPWHVLTRVGSTKNKDYTELFDYVKAGSFIDGEVGGVYKAAFDTSEAESFNRYKSS